ncbi:tetratricopeptide repeat protein [Bacillaceae bacterium SIJ1]|uniref:tetratricopeptide repeat protein n=1 Tax=Litoribacterium kuwaitense TaxID=1398745 RepID=UPI0013ED304F|nr:tetratricopeptide repeat protein [Litoribacterium kuwaitense]NGP43718.1 tetratricopeptide repeat protein [Litoribacterium kuwaitense]
MRIEEAVALVEEGRVQEGLEKLQQLEQSGDDEQLYQLAGVYAEWGQVQNAIRLYEELLQAYPEDGELQIDLAEVYLEDGRELDALELLNSFTEESPSFLRALVLSADVYASQGLEEVAEQKLMQAKREQPYNEFIDMALGSFYLEQGLRKSSALFRESIAKRRGNSFRRGSFVSCRSIQFNRSV